MADDLAKIIVMARLKGERPWKWQCDTCNHEFVLPLPNKSFWSGSLVTCPNCNHAGASALEFYSFKDNHWISVEGRRLKMTKNVSKDVLDRLKG